MPLSERELSCLREKTRQLRHLIVDITYWAGSAHIGGAMSMIDLAVLLYYRYMNIDPDNPDWEERDRFVLSKGHAGVAQAAILADLGFFDRELLKGFNLTGSNLGIHLDSGKVPGVDCSTGSLGHGLSLGVGLALAARLQQKSWITYCLLGDGECDEGSVWEAAMAASHYRVTNLITMVDRNGCMIDGPTEEIMGLEPLADKWRAFGFKVWQIDGHDLQAITGALDEALAEREAPACIIASTVKGKGIDFMENDYRWHYGGIDSEKRVQCRESIERYYTGAPGSEGEKHEH